MKNKKAFIYIGGSYPQIKGIKAIKDSGLSVILIDKSELAPCIEYADHHIKLSVTNHKKIIDFIRSELGSYEIVGIYGIGDYTTKTITHLRNFLKLNSNRYSDLENFSNKIYTHKLWDKGKFKKPKMLWSGKLTPSKIEISKFLTGQDVIVIKPSSSHNSSGIKILNSDKLNEIVKGISEALKFSPQVIVEEFINGEIINIDGLVINNEIHCSSLIKRGEEDINKNSSYFYAVTSRKLEERMKQKAIILSKQLVNLLGYKYGPFTIDTILNDNQFYPIEASPHLHAVSFYENLKKHPLRLWAKYLESRRLERSSNPVTNIGYCALTVKKYKIKINENLLKLFLAQNFIIDYYRYIDCKSNFQTNSRPKVVFIFWFRFRSEKSLCNIFNQLKGVVS